MNKKSLGGHSGMLEAYTDRAIEKPCSDECTILRQQAGLEYPDGSNANIDTGMWHVTPFQHVSFGSFVNNFAGFTIWFTSSLALPDGMLPATEH
jgi:hypothetical protein